MSSVPSSQRSLQQQCMLFILMHLEEIPPSYLALLPLSIRREILNRLPIADVCKLEETPFVDGLDLEVYWDRYHHFIPEFSGHLREICIAKWGTLQFAKSACHAGVIRCLLDLNLRSLQMTDDDNNWFMFPVSEELTTLMFTIRSFSPSAKDFPYLTIDCIYQFPSRYNQYQDWSYTFTYDAQVSAAVDGFGGQLPRMLNLRLDSRSIRISDQELDLCSDLECLEILVTTKRKLKDALRIIEKASKLEILAIEYYARTNISWTELAKLPLTNLHTLVLLNFVMTQESFFEFVRMFLSMPCSHPQKLILERVTVNSLSGSTVHKFGQQGNPMSTVPFWPELELNDRSYLHLKTVEVAHAVVKTNQLVLSWSKGGSLSTSNGCQKSNKRNSRKRTHTPSKEIAPQNKKKKLRK